MKSLGDFFHCVNIIECIHTNLDGIAFTLLGFMVYHHCICDLSLTESWLDCISFPKNIKKNTLVLQNSFKNMNLSALRNCISN